MARQPLDDDLPQALASAVDLLREPPPASVLWRARVLHAIDAPRPAARRRWSLVPSTAIAAGIGCILLGAAATLGVQRIMAERAPVAASRSVPDTTLPVRFTFAAPGASAVYLVGDFNGWNAQSLPLRPTGDGMSWIVEVPLPPGRYAYSFLVDGKLARDPAAASAADADFGATNSVVMVTRPES